MHRARRQPANAVSPHEPYGTAEAGRREAARSEKGAPVVTEPKVRFRRETGLSGQGGRTASDPKRTCFMG